MDTYGVEENADAVGQVPGNSPPTSGVLVAPGLHLPDTGLVWALDTIAGKPALVRVKYIPTELNNHKASNFFKAQAAPFIYKPKATIELKGASSELKIHNATPTLYVRSPRASADSEARNEEIHCNFALIRLEVKSDHRLAGTIAFTQITGTAARAQNMVEAATERVAGSDWFSIKPTQPLAAGEYGLMNVPTAQNQYALSVYDFSIDPSAPPGSGYLSADSEMAR